MLQTAYFYRVVIFGYAQSTWQQITSLNFNIS